MSNKPTEEKKKTRKRIPEGVILTFGVLAVIAALCALIASMVAVDTTATSDTNNVITTTSIDAKIVEGQLGACLLVNKMHVFVEHDFSDRNRQVINVTCSENKILSTEVIFKKTPLPGDYEANSFVGTASGSGSSGNTSGSSSGMSVAQYIDYCKFSGKPHIFVEVVFSKEFKNMTADVTCVSGELTTVKVIFEDIIKSSITQKKFINGI